MPTPYWTGFYASRPILKIYHYETTRTLLFSEILYSFIYAQNISNSNITQKEIDFIWNDFVPSNHHDFIRFFNQKKLYFYFIIGDCHRLCIEYGTNTIIAGGISEILECPVVVIQFYW